MDNVDGNTTSLPSNHAIQKHDATQEATQTQQWHSLCTVYVDDTAVVRIPATFSNDVPMSRPARWNAITPGGNFCVRWGPDSQDRSQTIITQGWDALCAANGITLGTVVVFELLGVCRRLLPVNVKEEIIEPTSQGTQ